jgi:cysteine desulfurase
MPQAYLDNNATTRVDSRVADVVTAHLVDEFGNAGSRTHEYGTRANRAVEEARRHLAAAVGARPDEVVFTSGATEANNLAILGLAEHGRSAGRTHLVTTAVEHKAVLEPFDHLAKHGFEATIVPVDASGWPDPAVVAGALRENTLLVSTMHVNNETGVELPLAAYSKVLAGHPAYWHVDAAQGFGKASEALRDPRIDLVAMSGHKLHAPKGVGALIARRRGYDRPPLTPLQFGGGQERGLRPGTLPVALVAGLGEAVRLAEDEVDHRRDIHVAYRERVLAALAPLGAQINGDPDRTLPHVLNVMIPGVDAEAAMVALKNLVAVSNGSACTSTSYEPSHVLAAMGFAQNRIEQSLRISWDHDPPDVDWEEVAGRLHRLVG